MLNKRQTTRTPRTQQSGFTLLELTITIAIVAILLTVGSIAFNSVRRHRSVDEARNAIVSYAGVARSYAIANQIETMLVINPYNGRFEIWHLNPPAYGGKWDPDSNDSSDPTMADGYAFAPVLDSEAKLPTDGNGDPLVYVNPINYQERMLNPTGVADQDFDNLIWTAFCFDENGALIQRTRRIATRTFSRIDGTSRPGPINRLRSVDDTSIKQAQAPALQLLDPALNPGGPQKLVTYADSLITSTRGFVVSERKAFESAYGTSFTANQLANGWLMNTRYQGQYQDFSQEVLLDRYSAEPLNKGDE